jgi:hypothetical protein
MRKVVKLILDNIYTVVFQKDGVSFNIEGIGNVQSVALEIPIEVFYQMYNSPEMIEHMEEYHRRRSDQ